MKREIKFRMWDKEESSMHSHDTLRFDYIFDNIDNDDEFEIMQFTGLKDKNGKEIYEGDIISESVYEIPVVYCGEDLFAIEFIGTGFAKRKADNKRGIWYLSEYYMPDNIPDRLQNIEVIGNIYENPELIN